MSTCFGSLPVAAALFVGVVLMIVVEAPTRAAERRRLARPRARHPLRAFLIGLGQCFSAWPALALDVYALAVPSHRLSTATSAEFSFLLAPAHARAATLVRGAQSAPELASSVRCADLGRVVVSFFWPGA